MTDDPERQQRPFTPTEWTRRIVGSWSVGRGQRHCPACGCFLPLAWTAEVCQACQDGGPDATPA